MTTKGTATATIDEKTTTIDHDTGDVRRTVKGRFNGFGEGLKDYIMKGGKQKLSVEVNTGSYPEGHAKVGQWAVQIMVGTFANQTDANIVGDKLAAQIRQLLNPPAASMPKPIGEQM